MSATSTGAEAPTTSFSQTWHRATNVLIEAVRTAIRGADAQALAGFESLVGLLDVTTSAAEEMQSRLSAAQADNAALREWLEDELSEQVSPTDLTPGGEGQWEEMANGGYRRRHVAGWPAAEHAELLRFSSKAQARKEATMSNSGFVAISREACADGDHDIVCPLCRGESRLSAPPAPPPGYARREVLEQCERALATVERNLREPMAHGQLEREFIAPALTAARAELARGDGWIRVNERPAASISIRRTTGISRIHCMNTPLTPAPTVEDILSKMPHESAPVLAEAVLALFAPIVAERDRLARELAETSERLATSEQQWRARAKAHAELGGEMLCAEQELIAARRQLAEMTANRDSWQKQADMHARTALRQGELRDLAAALEALRAEEEARRLESGYRMGARQVIAARDTADRLRAEVLGGADQ